jgi:hypothetical protein
VCGSNVGNVTNVTTATEAAKGTKGTTTDDVFATSSKVMARANEKV